MRSDATPGAIREATGADEHAVVALWRACGLVVGTNDPGADFRLAVGGPASAVLLLMRCGALSGTVMVGHDGHRGWLYYLGIAQACRGEGHGRRLVAAAEAWLAERQIPKAQLLVRASNAQVVGFYERLGYAALPRTVMQRTL